MLPHITSNRVKALAVTSPKRFAGLPNVPTMIESGLPQIGSTAWYGAFAPAGISAPMLGKLHADFLHVLKLPDMKEFFERGGADVVGDSPEHFAKFLRSEIEVARKLLKASGAKRG
jgi:tripartite-type tricarboxylate transporter receptor subunit TctC